MFLRFVPRPVGDCMCMLTFTAPPSLLSPPTIFLATPPSLPLLLLVAAPQIFKDATLFFSRGSPTIAAVIPAMDLIDNTLTDAARPNNDALDPAIRTAAGIAKRTLNRYYKMSDMSATYRIAMGECHTSSLVPRHPYAPGAVLHPRHKAHYFERAGWPKTWVKEALQMVREEYDAHYRHLDERGTQDNGNHTDSTDDAHDDEHDDTPAGTAAKPHTKAGPVKNVSGLDKVCASDVVTSCNCSLTPARQHVNLFDLMEAEDGPQGTAGRDVLEEYLATPPEACPDPVKYWSSRKGSVPGLARMALDYSTIPGMSLTLSSLHDLR